MNKKVLYPIIKFRSTETYPDNTQGIPACIIKMQDFLRLNGTLNISEIRKVTQVGSLHEYLGFDGQIILSTIMPDEILNNISYCTHEQILDTLQPEVYFTPDAFTYFGCKKVSRQQIEKILGITERLLDRFPGGIPIGLIKGSNLYQIDFHLDKLLEMGIEEVCLHAGDALYKEPIYSKNQVVDYAHYLREKVSNLMIYGVGSKHYFRRFDFADRFATSSHWMQAYNHRVIRGATWMNFKGEPTKEIIMQNFGYLRRLVEQRSTQDLSRWITTQDESLGSSVKDQTIDEKIVKILGNYNG